MVADVSEEYAAQTAASLSTLQYLRPKVVQLQALSLADLRILQDHQTPPTFRHRRLQYSHICFLVES